LTILIVKSTDALFVSLAI